MAFLEIKKKEDERLKRIEELEKRIKKLGEPLEKQELEKPVDKKEEKIQTKNAKFSEFIKKEEPKEDKKIIEEVHNTIKEAVKSGTISIDTTVKSIMTSDVSSSHHK